VSDRLDKIAQAGEIMRQSDIRLGMDVERARIVSIIKPLGCQANGVEHDCNVPLHGWSANDIIALITEGTND
jgi:hypothetical protein